MRFNRNKTLGVLKLVAAWALVLAVWEAAYRVFGWRPWIFPAPSHVLDALLAMLGQTTAFGEPLSGHWPMPAGPAAADKAAWSSPLIAAIVVSSIRLAIGFGIALVLGMALGLAMWRFKFIDALLGPLFLGLQTLPSVCWVPLAILVFGINERGMMFVLIMGSFFAIAIALRDGLRTTPPIYRAAGLMLGAHRWKLYRYVMLPAGLPAMASSLRQGFSFAWRSLMGGELILLLQHRGLGFLLQQGRDFADIAQVVAVMFVMVGLSMLVDRLVFAKLEARVRNRFGLTVGDPT